MEIQSEKMSNLVEVVTAHVSLAEEPVGVHYAEMVVDPSKTRVTV